MCGGGTLPFRPTASINANCPCVSSPVARNVSRCPLYQTDCFKDCRTRPNAARCSVPAVALNGVAMIGSVRFELKSATQPERGKAAQAARRANCQEDKQLRRYRRFAVGSVRAVFVEVQLTL